MTKLHQRVTRYWSDKRGRSRSYRAKTFTNEESAHAWAKQMGLENYSLENMKSPESQTKKIRVIVEI